MLPDSGTSADRGLQLGSEAVPGPEQCTPSLTVMTQANQIYLPFLSWVFYFSVCNALPDVSFSHAEESSLIEFGFMLALTEQTVSIQNGLLPSLLLVVQSLNILNNMLW